MDPKTVEAHREVAERVESTSAAVQRIELRNRRLSRIRMIVFVVWLVALTIGIGISLWVLIDKQDAGQREALRQETEILRIAKADSASLSILQQATGAEAQAQSAATLKHAIVCIEARVDYDVKAVPMPAGCPSP